MIGIVDYGAGNLRSVQKALEKYHCATMLVHSADQLNRCDKIVLPGVGAFGKAMQALAQLGLIEPLRRFVAAGKPFLGICLGLQLIFERSEESPHVAGLGLLPGVVRRLPETVKTPHLGWNVVRHQPSARLWQNIPPSSFFYFAHSYYAEPRREEGISAWCEYGIEFAVALEIGSLFLVQFHPEKSQRWGLKIMENFIHS